MKFQKKLTKKELQHLKETTTRGTLTEFRRNREHQQKEGIKCFDCRRIALKLGVEKVEG